MSHDLPELPEGWVVATNIEQHISLLYADGDGRSIAVKPMHPDSDQWKTIGVAGYAPDAPVFTRYVSLNEAISTACSVMKTVGDEAVEPVEPIKTIGADFNDDADVVDGDDNNSGESGSDDPQADLTSFV